MKFPALISCLRNAYPYSIDDSFLFDLLRRTTGLHSLMKFRFGVYMFQCRIVDCVQTSVLFINADNPERVIVRTPCDDLRFRSVIGTIVDNQPDKIIAGLAFQAFIQIDGRMDTQSKLTPGDDTESQPTKQPNQKPSVLEKLKQKKDAVEEQEKLPPLPQPETGRDHTPLE